MTLRPGVRPTWGPMALTDNRTFPIGQVGPFEAGGQRSAVALKLTVAGYAQAANASDPNSDNEYYVVVDLTDSTVSPGNLGADDDENRGFYTHAIEVRMTLAGDAA